MSHLLHRPIALWLLVATTLACVDPAATARDATAPDAAELGAATPDDAVHDAADEADAAAPPDITCRAPTLPFGSAEYRAVEFPAAPSVTDCQGRTGRGARFALEVPAGYRAMVRASARRDEPRVEAFFEDACTGQCLTNTRREEISTATTQATWTNEGSAARTVTLLAFDVTGQSSGAGLTVSIDPLPGASCEAAPLLRGAGPFLGLAREAMARGPACGAGTTPTAPAAWYRVTVPAGEDLRASVSPSRGSSLRVYDGCGPSAACLFTRRDVSLTPSAGWANTGATPRTVFLAATVSADYPGAGFTLSVGGGPPAPHASCGDAAPLTPGVPRTGERVPLRGTPATACDGVDPRGGGSLWYRVRVPAGRLIRAAVTVPHEDAGITLQLRRACGGACLATGNSTMESPQGLVWRNDGADSDVLLAVTPYLIDHLASFDVSVTLLDAPPAVQCVTAPPLAPLTARPVETSVDPREGLPTTGSCAGGAPAGSRSLFYRVEVPAGQTVVAEGSAHLRFLETCGAVNCNWSQGWSGDQWTSYANPSDAPRTVVLEVAGTGMARFSVHALPARPNGRCAAARPLFDVGAAESFDLTHNADRGLCGGEPFVRPLFFSVSLPAGTTLVVSVASSHSVLDRPGLALMLGCDATACLARATPPPDGVSYAGVSLTYTNRTAATQPLVLALYNEQSSERLLSGPMRASILGP